MIILEEITQEEYNRIATENGTSPTPKPNLKYFKVLEDGIFVAIRCGEESKDISYGVQFIVLKEYKGYGTRIMKAVINSILMTDIKVYRAVWNETVYTLLKKSFKMTVKEQKHGYGVRITSRENVTPNMGNNNYNFFGLNRSPKLKKDRAERQAERKSQKEERQALKVERKSQKKRPITPQD